MSHSYLPVSEYVLDRVLRKKSSKVAELGQLQLHIKSQLHDNAVRGKLFEWMLILRLSSDPVESNSKPKLSDILEMPEALEGQDAPDGAVMDEAYGLELTGETLAMDASLSGVDGSLDPGTLLVWQVTPSLPSFSTFDMAIIVRQPSSQQRGVVSFVEIEAKGS